MDKQELLTILQEAYPDMVFQLQGMGCHFQIKAIGECFADLNRVKRQQLLNVVLKPFFIDGSIHAVNYTLLTPTEAKEVKEI